MGAFWSRLWNHAYFLMNKTRVGQTYNFVHIIHCKQRYIISVPPWKYMFFSYVCMHEYVDISWSRNNSVTFDAIKSNKWWQMLDTNRLVTKWTHYLQWRWFVEDVSAKVQWKLLLTIHIEVVWTDCHVAIRNQ